MPTLVERTWSSEVLTSTERFQLVTVGDGYALHGAVDIHHEDLDIRYEVSADAAWLTTAASIIIPGRGISLEVEVAEPGRWLVNGRYRPDLDRCLDIDLGWTPATNTLPIRRLRPERGVAVTTRAAWLRWPELVFVPAAQTYTKLTDRMWTYRQGDFTAPLEVDGLGVVVTYGRPPIWDGRPAA